MHLGKPLCAVQLASHSELLRQSVQFYVGRPEDITAHCAQAAPPPPSTQAGHGERYSAIYNAMYN
jgi:hypothetical protein